MIHSSSQPDGRSVGNISHEQYSSALCSTNSRGHSIRCNKAYCIWLSFEDEQQSNQGTLIYCRFHMKDPLFCNTMDVRLSIWRIGFSCVSALWEIKDSSLFLLVLEVCCGLRWRCTFFSLPIVEQIMSDADDFATSVFPFFEVSAVRFLLLKWRKGN